MHEPIPKHTAMTESSARRLTWLTLGLALVLRLILSSQFLLSPDETNYWQWSRYLDRLDHLAGHPALRPERVCCPPARSAGH